MPKFFLKALAYLWFIFFLCNFFFIIPAAAIAPKIWIEAEDGALHAPMQSAKDNKASSGEFIWVSDGSGGYADYAFSISDSGFYNLWGRVLGTTSKRNSFNFSFDSARNKKWNFSDSSSWSWDRATITYLAAGQHTLRIGQKEKKAQLDRILITNDLRFVPQGLGAVAIPPTAAFAADPTSGGPTLTVNFTDQSKAGDGAINAWLWNFGDGGTSRQQNPTYTYNQPGLYTVSLQVSDSQNQIDESSQTELIQVTAATQSRIWIEAENGDIYAPLKIAEDPNASANEFVWATTDKGGYAEYSLNLTESGTYYIWGRVIGTTGGRNSFFLSIDSGQDLLFDFPITSEWIWDQIATVQFEAGQHILRVKQREYRAHLDKILISKDPDFIPAGMGDESTAPVAAFSANPTSGNSPLVVTFMNESTGAPGSWAWDFNDDGVVDSTLKNPTYTYSNTGTYSVKLTVTTAGGSDNEIKIDYITVDLAPPVPVAEFWADQTSGSVPLEVSFRDQSTGAPTSWSWDFDNDGAVDSTLQNPTHEYLSAGTYSVKLAVQAVGGDHVAIKDNLITVSSGTPPAEHFFVMPIFQTSFHGFKVLLRDMGATQQDAVTWKYMSPSGQEWIIHEVRDAAGIRDALRYPGGTLVVKGHANYGIGPAPCSDEENAEGRVNRILYIDDPGIVNISSPFFSASLGGLKAHFSPDWRPIFKEDGVSGIMPFGFLSPKGPPPFNYYLTYILNGQRYKIESLRSSAMIRMVDADTPAWDPLDPLAAGLADPTQPDPNNPEHRKFFMAGLPLSNSTTGWQKSSSIPGYWGNNYKSIPPGSGNKEVWWEFKIPQNGSYKISAFWPASQSNTADALFLINTEAGLETSRQNQTVNGGKWNVIGDFNFKNDAYYVKITDNPPAGSAPSGNVIADAIRIEHSSANPPDIVQANFRTSPRSAVINTQVSYYDQSTGFVTDWLWDFGDGSTSTQANPTHYYTASGTYAVTLKVTGLAGVSQTTAVNYIAIGDSPPAVQAEFSNSSQVGNIEAIPARIEFIDRSTSTGTIVAWEWDLNGDGVTDSSNQQPKYTYGKPGLYDVYLTVTDNNGNRNTKIKQNYVRAVVYDVVVDNDTYPSSHYDQKIVLYRRDLEVPQEELRYKRLLWESCTSGPYYLSSLQHGIVHFTVGPSANRCGEQWMKGVLEGKTDMELWETCQSLEAKYNYFDFSRTPAQQD